ncbi:MAG: pyruvate kinase [Candidatus Aquicultor secundus]|uniref:Pyruvate kinase n=1 Tax=Candidatus Aquicultor secundus TaxID=1973895 RepID=A0A2M7T601_9ACTN|nr:pyruvate kinase [Candidatus Aquicultor secundus]NCO65540.1 pyruvate kinase [Solirubrobacter sp.]OIO87948.1 MAG: pyruvate kinase [Candidatus Aquicultor secundus]PIU26482.1 MAG: pyruvate kinase [Candidatus Aquicultor secundus]PIW21913.1 MAG: pyruvate kinase [Candidatus Aquicultor secundus]PIX53108.1 MAG: pyruvate kinase [Candidatus Aquicultor secundus]
MRHAKIVCTIGPASRDIEVMRKLLDGGMDVARINMAHGSHEDHAATIANIRQLESESGKPIAVLMDLAGPKLRIGDVENGEVIINEGDDFTVTTRPVMGTNEIVSINYPDLPRDVKAGDTILIDEGLIILEVLGVGEEDVRTRVIEGGPLNSKRGVHLPGVMVSLSPLSEKDRLDLAFGLEQGVDWIGLSFVRNSDDVKLLKSLVAEAIKHAKVIAKIEKQEAVKDIDNILEVADGVMVARGDLGIEMPTEMVPLVQKMIINKCMIVGKPVITATQMLDSMIRNPRPTRAEVSDVANAVLDGTDALMLSGETAMGRFPVESVSMMARTIIAAERDLSFCIDRGAGPRERERLSTTQAISKATCEIASALRATAIITSTQSGETARQVAKHHPAQPIIAISPSDEVVRQLNLTWGVIPLKVGPSINLDNMFDIAVDAPLKADLIEKGDRVVITAGVFVNVPGTTNLIKVHRV